MTLLRGRWYLIDGINPEPWTAPEASIGRRGGKLYTQVYKSEQLRSYQEAIKSSMQECYPDTPITDKKIELEFYFWRELPAYKGDSERAVRKHQADATNMQKALEDALQGILYTNDKNVVSIQSVIMAQGHTVDPMILIAVYDDLTPHSSVSERAAMMLAQRRVSRPKTHEHLNPKQIEEIF